MLAPHTNSGENERETNRWFVADFDPTNHMAAVEFCEFGDDDAIKTIFAFQIAEETLAYIDFLFMCVCMCMCLAALHKCFN